MPYIADPQQVSIHSVTDSETITRRSQSRLVTNTSNTWNPSWIKVGPGSQMASQHKTDLVLVPWVC